MSPTKNVKYESILISKAKGSVEIMKMLKKSLLAWLYSNGIAEFLSSQLSTKNHDVKAKHKQDYIRYKRKIQK